MVFGWHCGIVQSLLSNMYDTKTDRLACFLAFAWVQKVLDFFPPWCNTNRVGIPLCYFCDFLLGKLWSVLFRWGVGASPKIDVNKKKSTRWIILVGYVVFVVVFFLYGWWVLSESWHLEKMISFHGPLPTKLLLLKEFMVEINTQLFKCHKPIPVNFQVTWSGWCLRNPVVARFFYRGSWGSPMHMELRNGPPFCQAKATKESSI